MTCSCKSAIDCFVVNPRPQPRQTYTDRYKWPESDAEFLKSVAKHGSSSGFVRGGSCRQMYLRSYTFKKKKESISKKAAKWLNRIKNMIATGIAGVGFDEQKKYDIKKTVSKKKKLSK